MNPMLGVLLLCGLVITTLRFAGRDDVGTFLLLVFWGLFGVFTFIEKGNPPGRLDPVSWIWVEASIVPGGHPDRRPPGRRDGEGENRGVDALRGRLAVRGGAAGIGGWADEASAPRRTCPTPRNHEAQMLAIDTVDRVRARPLRAVALAAGAGVAIGVLAGFCVGWWLGAVAGNRKPEVLPRARARARAFLQRIQPGQRRLRVEERLRGHALAGRNRWPAPSS